MPTNTQDPTIRNFVVEVKSRLADLNPADVDGLTENLEADLLERQLEEGDDFKLGSPDQFARDLRTAAGIDAPEKEVSPLRRLVNRAAKWTWQLVRSARPAWWLVRGYLLFWLWGVWFNPGGFLPDNFLQWVILVGLTVASIVVGRKTWRRYLVRVPLAVLNVGLIIVGLIWGITLQNSRDDYMRMHTMDNAGVLMWNGYWITQPKAFDANGTELPMVELRDVNGNVIFHEQPQVLPKELQGIVNLTLPEAIKKLSKTEIGGVDINYEKMNGVKPGTVTALTLSTDDSGVAIVLLKVAE